MALELDARNPRIPKSPDARDTRGLLAELVHHDKVLSIAQSIAARGYFPTEVMIAVVENGKKIVLEGNRRLAALRLLISPDAAPDDAKKKFKELADGLDTSKIAKVPVVFAPSRKAAAPIIATRHNAEQILSWSPVQQAAYFRSLIDEGMSVAEVSKLVGFTIPQVAEFLRDDLAYQVACNLKGLKPEDEAKVRDPREFPASTLARLLDNKGVRDWLGIEVDPEGKIVGKTQVGEFEKGFRRLVADVASGKINSRNINKAPEIAAYIGSIKTDETPDTKKKGSFTADDLLKGTGGTTKPASRPRTKPTTAKKSRSLIPKGLRCAVKDPRICEIFEELKGLYVEEYPNAAGVMLRVLFELSLGYWLDKSGKAKPLYEKAKKDGKPKDWAPTLRQMLRLGLADDELTKNLSPQNLKALNKAVSDDDHLFSIDAMDGIVHNRYGMLSERILRGLWTMIEDLLSVTLTEYKPPAPAPAPKSTSFPTPPKASHAAASALVKSGK